MKAFRNGLPAGGSNSVMTMMGGSSFESVNPNTVTSIISHGNQMKNIFSTTTSIKKVGS
jgi:hypothetical protein